MEAKNIMDDIKCKICGAEGASIIFEGPIRDGKPGNMTIDSYEVWQCPRCQAIWHDVREAKEAFYETPEYRLKLEGTADIDGYYKNHDWETLRKLDWTGTAAFRGKVVADVGAGGGSFLDFVQGSAAQIIAIEPSETYRKALSQKGYTCYAYAEQACADYEEKIDLVTSFDVIEHVEDPVNFCKAIHKLLAADGHIILGTPTDYPNLRALLGKEFEGFLFSVQHPWILLKPALIAVFEQAGYHNIQVVHKQMYGLGNMLAWAYHRCAPGHITYDFITQTMDATYRAQMEESGQSDYLVVYAEK